MAQRITRDEVVHVARLACLTLTEEEVDRFTQQLGAILLHAADIESLDVSGVEPTAHPLPLCNVMRADVVERSLNPAAVLAQAPEVRDGQFLVSPVLGDQP